MFINTYIKCNVQGCKKFTVSFSISLIIGDYRFTSMQHMNIMASQ